MKFAVNEKGMSLINVTIAGAILAGMAAVSMRMSQTQSQITRRANDSQNLISHMEQVKLALSDPITCREVFSGGGPLDTCEERNTDGGFSVIVDNVTGTGERPLIQEGLSPPQLPGYIVSRMELNTLSSSLGLAIFAVTYERQFEGVGGRHLRKEYLIRFENGTDEDGNPALVSCSSSTRTPSQIAEVKKIACEIQNGHQWTGTDCVNRITVLPPRGTMPDEPSMSNYNCPEGTAAVGLQLRHFQDKIERVRVLCRKFGVEENLLVAKTGQPLVSPSDLGNDTNGSFFSLERSLCPPSNPFVKGFSRRHAEDDLGRDGESGDELGSMIVYCGQSSFGLPTGADSPGNTAHNNFPGAILGPFAPDDDAGSRQNAFCPSDSVLVGVRGRMADGEVYKNILATCMKLSEYISPPEEGEVGDSCSEDPEDPEEPGCFTAGTEIQLHDGSRKAIEDVVLGDILKAPSGEKTVVRDLISHRFRGKKYSINGSPYFVTDNHPLKSLTGWKAFNPESAMKGAKGIEVTKLKLGDALLTERGIEVVWDYSFVRTDETVYNLTVDGAHEYIADGFHVHNEETDGDPPPCPIPGDC